MNASAQNNWSSQHDYGRQASPPQKEVKLSRRIRLLHRRELDSVLQPGWAVKGLLPQTGLAVFYGPSGAGKSFLLLDMVCAVAEGADWFGRRTNKAPIIYLCLEGAPGFVSRIKAWEAAHKRALPELVRCSFQPFDIHDPDAVDSLLHSVMGLMSTLPDGLPAPVVVVDTLSRATAGADENGPVAMGLTTNACARIADATGGLVVLVHHTGKDMDRGMRGHNSLFAAADCVVLVQRSGEHRAFEVKKAKDGEDGIGAGFELETVVLGVDPDGDQVTSCVVTAAEAPDAKTRQAVPRGVAPALVALKELLPEVSSAGPPRVLEERWRDAFVASCTAASSSGKRSALSRARATLLECSLVVTIGEFLEVTPAGMDMLSKL
jgi:hypothetical protein